MFANITWKKFFITLATLALLAGAGLAMRVAEDGQVGTDNIASTTVFVCAGLGCLYALAVLAILLRRRKAGKG